jgi:hypothetical protein
MQGLKILKAFARLMKCPHCLTFSKVVNEKTKTQELVAYFAFHVEISAIFFSRSFRYSHHFL